MNFKQRFNIEIKRTIDEQCSLLDLTLNELQNEYNTIILLCFPNQIIYIHFNDTLPTA